MKIPRLHELDLARFAPMSEEQKRRELQRHRQTRPPYTYNPFRSTQPDILNEQHRLFAQVPPTRRNVVAEQISRRSKSEAELDANLEVGLALFDYAAECDLRSRRHELYPLALGSGMKIEYWRPLIITSGMDAVVPFFDPRRSRGLGADARRFVLSVMHEGIRATDPDMVDVKLAIFRFEPIEEGGRRVVRFTDEGVSLYTADQLEHMISETYMIWHEVLTDRRADDRRAQGGGGQ